jgi:hypothetical protein
MTKRDEKAISILTSQRNKIQSLDRENYYSWQLTTVDYLGIIFGKDSRKYDFLSRFSIVNDLNYADQEIRGNIKQLTTFLNDCIESVKHYGAKKKEWKHILMTTNPALFWSIFVVIVTVTFWAGTRTGHTSNESVHASKNKPQTETKSVHMDSPATRIIKPDTSLLLDSTSKR